jgi:hypothetical protein
LIGVIHPSVFYIPDVVVINKEKISQGMKDPSYSGVGAYTP